MQVQPDEAAPARIDALDGVRGLAILVVVLFHALLFDPGLVGAGPPDTTSPYIRIASLGWCGVDVFFVLSGFLITGILLRAKGAPHYFRDFYMRRVLRIFPLYYAVVVLLLFVLDRPPATPSEKASYLLYYQNVRYALWGEEYFDPARLITWSLAIEEQFYLVWPALVWTCSRRSLLRVCVAAIAVAIALRFVLLANGLVTTHFLTPCRIDTLAAGALIAILGAPPRWCGWLALLGGAAVLLGVATTTGAPWPEAEAMQRYGLLGALALAVGVLTLALRGGAVAAVCRFVPLRSLGKYSYCVYLVHFLVIDAAARAAADLPPDTKQWLAATFSPLGIMLLFAGACLVASWTVAFASWHLFEKWFLALKRYFSARPAH